MADQDERDTAADGDAVERPDEVDEPAESRDAEPAEADTPAEPESSAEGSDDRSVEEPDVAFSDEEGIVVRRQR
ncbi:MAG: hypothetical protein AAGA56_19870, partial [Myxococcota bacterium]